MSALGISGRHPRRATAGPFHPRKRTSRWQLARRLRANTGSGGPIFAPNVRSGALKPDNHRDHCWVKMPHLHHDLRIHPTNACWAGQRQ